MAEEYPYVLNNGKLGSLLDKIGTAAKPERFSYDFLDKLGFTSTNDRGFVSLLRRLGFLSEANQPTAFYDDLRDKNRRPFTLAAKIRELYSELFALNEKIHKASDVELRGAISRVTGKDEQTVNRVFNTFKALVAQGNFDDVQSEQSVPAKEELKKPQKGGDELSRLESVDRPHRRTEASFHYNIQIVLPTTTEVAVYNAIFRSLRDNLNI